MSFGPIQVLPCTTSYVQPLPFAAPAAAPAHSPDTTARSAPVDPALAGRSLFFSVASPPPPAAAPAKPLAPATTGPKPVGISQLSATSGLFFDTAPYLPAQPDTDEDDSDDTPEVNPADTDPALTGWDGVRQVYGQTHAGDAKTDHTIEQLYQNEENAETASAQKNLQNLVGALRQDTQNYYATINPGGNPYANIHGTGHDPYANIHNPFAPPPAKKKKKKH